MGNMKKILFTVMLIIISCVHTEYTNLKIDYLEELIATTTEQAKSYSLRLDNSDLFKNLNDDIMHDFGEFDFIIVGAGSSGSVVARRLSEVEKWKILVLEAGDFDDDLTDIPYYFNVAAFSDRNWGYNTIPQKNGCSGRVRSECPYIRGKVLGGSGSINGLVYTRANAADFDRWAALGNPGWAYKDVLPYFKKMENYESDKVDRAYRGVFGPLNCAYSEPVSPFHETFVRSNVEVGIPFVEDNNAASQIGVSRIQRNIEFGKRVSGATNYIKPVLTRFNLNLTTKAYVTKILIHENNKTAHGVQFVSNGKYYIANARKEVILNGGSVNTPQLLMLSGIGPRNELKNHGIPVLQDSPVGNFMKDHINFNNIYFRTNYSENIKPLRELIEEYLRGEGLLTNQVNSQSVTFINTRNNESTFPDIEIVQVAPSPVKENPRALNNYNEEVQQSLTQFNTSTDLQYTIFLLHPKSTGALRLKSKSPKDFPLIDSNIFADNDDLETIHKAVMLIVKLSETKAMKRFNPKLYFNIPACSDHRIGCRKYWQCLIKQLSFPAYHISGTARMGRSNHPLSVVDAELKVYGIKRLRVADCSVLPITVSGHMNAQAFLIGEKAANLIKKTHSVRS